MTSPMKSCPICGREYADDMRFCLEDGTPLAGMAKPTEMVTEEYGAKTEMRPTAAETAEFHVSTPHENHRRSNTGVYVFVAFLLTGILIVVGVPNDGATRPSFSPRHTGNLIVARAEK